MKSKESEPISLLFSGDLAPTGRVEEVCKLGRQEEFISGIKSLFLSVDLHITNLECPLTKATQAIDKSGPAIKADPSAINLLKSLNVGLACMANNHIRDYGTRGVLDTVSICELNHIQTVGVGENPIMARKIKYIELKGKTLAFINYCEEEFSIAYDNEAGANHLDPINAYHDITEALKVTPLVFVILHGGHEEYPLPSPRVKKIFHYMADLGAAAVIGHHPHVVSGFEWYNGKPLVYSLGNFIFDEPENPFTGWHLGGLAMLVIHQDNSIELDTKYIKQEKTELGIIQLMQEELEEARNRCLELSSIIADDNQLEQAWKKFVRRFETGFIKQTLQLNLFQRALYKLGLFRSVLVQKKDLLPMLNLVQCEAHRDTLIHSIKNHIKSNNDSRHP